MASATAPVPPRQAPGSFMPGQGTGGAGEHWTAVFPRHLPDVFELLKSTKGKYGMQKLPEDHAVVDWGITWDRDRALLHTRGQARGRLR